MLFFNLSFNNQGVVPGKIWGVYREKVCKIISYLTTKRIFDVEKNLQYENFLFYHICTSEIWIQVRNQ